MKKREDVAVDPVLHEAMALENETSLCLYLFLFVSVQRESECCERIVAIDSSINAVWILPSVCVFTLALHGLYQRWQ